ncbi:MAG: hypothetical protein K2M31_03495 [Muribaculaceae bacterium]|nr:hypothetical protein [Muribaculaceae bacterium]
MKTLTIYGVVLLLLLGACGQRSNADGTIVETDAQLEEARNAGREAARKIITREFADSMEFHGAILDANAERSRFSLQNRKESEAAFDSAFISTIRTTRPDLARQLQ